MPCERAQVATREIWKDPLRDRVETHRIERKGFAVPSAGRVERAQKGDLEAGEMNDRRYPGGSRHIAARERRVTAELRPGVARIDRNRETVVGPPRELSHRTGHAAIGER